MKLFIFFKQIKPGKITLSTTRRVAMNRDERNEKYLRIFMFYSPNAQKIQAIQEFSELIQALTKDINNQGSRENLIEEIADSKIMLEQMQLLFDVDDQDLEKIMDKKIERQLTRIKNSISNLKNLYLKNN